MLVEQIWTANTYRNFNYLIACAETGDALAVDPLDHEKCLVTAKKRGWQITQIVNTHEHGDHTGGNRAMIAATGAKLLAHKNAAQFRGQTEAERVAWLRRIRRNKICAHRIDASYGGRPWKGRDSGECYLSRLHRDASIGAMVCDGHGEQAGGIEVPSFRPNR